MDVPTLQKILCQSKLLTTLVPIATVAQSTTLQETNDASYHISNILQKPQTMSQFTEVRIRFSMPWRAFI